MEKIKTLFETAINDKEFVRFLKQERLFIKYIRSTLDYFQKERPPIYRNRAEYIAGAFLWLGNDINIWVNASNKWGKEITKIQA